MDPADEGGSPVVTIRAVATLAGVSPSTVSRALNTPELVRAATRRRVLECAERLGYEPNRAARSLVLGRTATAGLIVPDIANPFFAPFIKAVQARLRDGGYTVFLADTDEDAESEVAAAQAMARQADGLIMCSPRMSGSRLRSLAARCPVVVANRMCRTVPSISMDVAPGLNAAIAHLHALGHRRIGFLGGPSRSWSNRQRVRFLSAGCAAKGIRLVELGPYEPRFPGGYRAADEALAADVTAVFAYNDLVALGVMARLAARGVRVPDEMSVMGFDDVPMASMVSPPLTTVAVPIDAVAQAAAAMLLSMLADRRPQRPAGLELATRLLIRSTTAPA